MQSAPPAIPATIAVSFPDGFTPAEATLEVLNLTRCPVSSDRPVRSAKPITGTRPAHDTRCSSSNTRAARDHRSGSFTPSAFCWLDGSGPRHSRFCNHRRHINVQTCRDPDRPPTDRGLARSLVLNAPFPSVLGSSPALPNPERRHLVRVMRLRRAAGRLLVEEEERRSVLIFLCVLLTFLCVAAALAGVGRRPAPRQGEDRLHAARSGRPIDRKRRGHSQAMLEPAGHGRHRWSGRRPRLTLTESGFRDTGARFRFCLDCTAERCE